MAESTAPAADDDGDASDDEEGYYEVEVTQADGSQTDVHLDSDFNVIDASSDGERES